jgi:hypothetical protein
MRKAEVQHPMVFSHVKNHESDRMLQLLHDVVKKLKFWNIRYLLKQKSLLSVSIFILPKHRQELLKCTLLQERTIFMPSKVVYRLMTLQIEPAVLFELDKKLSDYYNQVHVQG